MIDKITSFILNKEKYFFILFLVIYVSFIYTAEFFPTMDGPAHLYNANILKNLIVGSDFIESFFKINYTPIPNWTNHLVLTCSLFFTTPNLAEKTTFTCYALVLSLSFRFFIKQFVPSNVFGSSIIFVFLYSFLLHLGFINYGYSIGFMFLGTGYYKKHIDHFHTKHIVMLFLIVFLAYLSNVLGFIILLINLVAINFFVSFNNSFIFSKKNIVTFLNNNIKLLSVIIAPICCFIWFYTSVTFFPSDSKYQSMELYNWIFDLRALIVYNYNEDKEYTRFLFLLLMMALSVALYKLYTQNKIQELGVRVVVFLLLILVYFALLHVPDGSSAGMMSDRFCLLLAFLLITFFVLIPIPPKILIAITVLCLYVGLKLFDKNHKEKIINYSAHASTIYEASHYIENKSIVLPVKLGGDWLEGHFSNYIATDKELVVLENYEANVGWFPVLWKKDNMPKYLLGDRSHINNLNWMTNIESRISKQIDYVYLYGNTSKINEEENSNLKMVLDSFYIRDKNINDEYQTLFKLKKL